jgi:hypothetical protein
MFSFEFKESSLSDTLQDVASPHCDDKRKAWHCTRSSLPNYFVMTIISKQQTCIGDTTKQQTCIGDTTKQTCIHVGDTTKQQMCIGDTTKV